MTPQVGDTVTFTFPHQDMLVTGRVDEIRDDHVWLNYQDGHVLVHLDQIKELDHAELHDHLREFPA